MNAAFLGNLSAGKTCLAVRFVFGLAATTGRRVISNINLRFPPPYDRQVRMVRNEDLPRMALDDPLQFKDSILLMDELHTIAEARRSSAGLNVDFTQFVTQLGKLGCDLVYTAQILTSQIDLRVRELGDLFIFCTRYVLVDGAWRPAYLMPRKVSYPIRVNCISVLRIMGGLQQKVTKFSYYPTKFDYSLYDTEELVILDRNKFKKPASPWA